MAPFATSVASVKRWWAGRPVLALVLATGLVACSDLGDPPPTIPKTDEDRPNVTAVVPDSAAVGDTVRVDGAKLGSAAGSATLAGQMMAIAAWSDTSAHLVVPAGAISGSIRVRSAVGESNAISFRVIDGGGGGGGPVATLEELIPVRTVVGDTLRISGSGFGNDPGDWRVEFAVSGGGRVPASVFLWTDDEVMVEVPTKAVAGDVVVTDGERSSAGLPFDVAPRIISFGTDLRVGSTNLGLFGSNGCTACHFDRAGGNNRFSTASPADIRAGGIHGPAAVPRRAAESLLIQVLKGTAVGLPRMPQGGEMPAAQIQIVEDWVNQGMRDN